MLIFSSNNKPVDGILEKLKFKYNNEEVNFPYLRLGNFEDVKKATLRIRELYNYSTENSSGEIDFVIQQEMRCIPIEVKAEENLRARSLRAFCEKYKPEVAVRSSMSNYREQNWMVNVPLYILDIYLERQ